ncbi:MAG: undecaprenyldiphospho-muramoylpentapeptide beta-N-acetylglucosaminyltransferase [Ignavibacteria bacterium]|nr:undecaprenyldiphospho-muramoylpentapeptide beta-N-acetylglucosaminyltransferase [Ignavibacteria bacterium]
MDRGHPRILVAGGGTGGHLFPALAIADEIRRLRPGAEFLFVGTRGKIEARVVPERGYAFRTIWISGFQRRLTLDNLLFPLKVIVSLIQSLFVIRQFKPDVVIGTGGYVCGPVLLVASWSGIPTVVHESNSYPGITTRLLAKRADRLYIAFEATKRWLPRGSTGELVGTPTRAALGTISRDEGRRFFHLAADKKTVLVVGGSLGAASINRAVLASLDDLLRAGIQFVWQTGQSDYHRVRQTIGSKPAGWIGPFVDSMEHAFAAADVVVCRAGATTLAEVTRVGRPAIVVPYPHAAANHQTHNARALVEAGAVLMIADDSVSGNLKPALLELINDPHRLTRMSQASMSLGKPEAGSVLAEKILALLH